MPKAAPNQRLLPTSLRLWSKEYYQVKYLQRVQELLEWENSDKIRAKFWQNPLKFAGNHTMSLKETDEPWEGGAAPGWSWSGRRNIIININ